MAYVRNKSSCTSNIDNTTFLALHVSSLADHLRMLLTSFPHQTFIGLTVYDVDANSMNFFIKISTFQFLSLTC